MKIIIYLILSIISLVTFSCANAIDTEQVMKEKKAANEQSDFDEFDSLETAAVIKEGAQELDTDPANREDIDLVMDLSDKSQKQVLSLILQKSDENVITKGFINEFPSFLFGNMNQQELQHCMELLENGGKQYENEMQLRAKVKEAEEYIEQSMVKKIKEQQK